MLFWRVLTCSDSVCDSEWPQICVQDVCIICSAGSLQKRQGWMLETIQNDTKRQVVPLPARRARERSGWLSSQWHSASWHPARATSHAEAMQRKSKKRVGMNRYQKFVGCWWAICCPCLSAFPFAPRPSHCSPSWHSALLAQAEWGSVTVKQESEGWKCDDDTALSRTHSIRLLLLCNDLKRWKNWAILNPKNEKPSRYLKWYSVKFWLHAGSAMVS